MSNEGYKNLIVWKNARDLRSRVYKVTSSFPKSEYRRVSQMNDAARSVKQNIQEAYRCSLKKYLSILENIAWPSLEELLGDIEDCHEDGLIDEKTFKELYDLGKRTSYLFYKLTESLKKKLHK